MKERGYEKIVCEIVKKMVKAIGEQKKRQYRLGNASDKAMEGEDTEEVKYLIEKFAAVFVKGKKELHSGYDEEELGEIFDRQYEQLYGENAGAEENEKKEAAKQRFVILCKEYLKQDAKDTSAGEQMILRKAEAVGEDVRKTHVDIKEIQKTQKEQVTRFNQLCNDEKIPLLEVDNMGKVRVAPYNVELMVLANSIVLDATKDRQYDVEAEYGDVCIITLPVRNVGRTPINYIECRDLSVFFCGESESGSETSAAVLPMIKHSSHEGCYMNIAPGSVQKIHIVVTWNPEEEDEQVYEWYDWKMRYVEIGLAVSGEDEETEYQSCMFWRKIADWEIPEGGDVSLGKKRMLGEYEVEEMWMQKK